MTTPSTADSCAAPSSFPLCHNLCEGFNTLLLKSILNPISLERFIGDYKQWWLSWRDVSPGHRLLRPAASALLSFLTVFFDDIGTGTEIFGSSQLLLTPQSNVNIFSLLQRAQQAHQTEVFLWTYMLHVHLVKSPGKTFVQWRKTWKAVGQTICLAHSNGPITFVTANLASLSIPIGVRG